jgi:non-ribosomal peptide synthetase-like protein
MDVNPVGDLKQIPENEGPKDMASLFSAACSRFASRPAYQLDGAWITYADCNARVSNMAVSLRGILDAREHHSGKQPVIAILLPNEPAVLELFYMAALTHSIVFPINHRLPSTEIASNLHTSGATILVTSDLFRKTLLEIPWKDLPVRTIIWTSTAIALPVRETRSWDSLLTSSMPGFALPGAALPSAYLQGFGTSGTTGQIKTVLHSHYNVFKHSLASLDALQLQQDDYHCWGHFGPMFHVGDAVFVWIATLLGARHVFHDNQLHFAEVVQIMSSEGVTIVKLVPSLLQLICSSDALRGLSFPKLRWILTGGAPLDFALAQKSARLFGCDIVHGYGMTEATCHIAFKVETKHRESEGLRCLPGLELTIIDEHNKSLGPNDVGEIAIKGDTVFSGYITNGNIEEPDRKLFTSGGYFRTGDMGFLDRNGGLHITGRAKDMINVGGENVFAWEVEQVISRMEEVKECAAFAAPHDILGEVVEVAIVPKQRPILVEKITSHCRKQLATFKIPRAVHFIDALPRTLTGKVRKHLIAEQFVKTNGYVHPTHMTRPGPDDTAAVVERIVLSHMNAQGAAGVERDRPLFDLGLDSLGAITLMEELERQFQINLPQTFLFDYSTINHITAYFSGCSLTNARSTPDTTPDDKSQVEYDAFPSNPVSPTALVTQVIGLIVRPAMLAFSFLPVLIAFDISTKYLDGYALFLTGPLWLFGMLLNSMFVTVLIDVGLGGRRQSECALWSMGYFQWLFRHNLFRSLETPLGVLRGSGLLNSFYRCCGARIGRQVRLETLGLQDLHFVRIGNGSVIGRDANIQPATIHKGRLVRRPIDVGANCVIGPNASLLGGSSIPDHGHVSALTASAGNSGYTVQKDPTAETTWYAALWRWLIDAFGIPLRALGYLLVGYITTASIAVGILFVRAAVELSGSTLPSISGILFYNSRPAAIPLVFFVAIALAIYLVIPTSFFFLVVISKRLLLRNVVSPGSTSNLNPHLQWSHWIYSKLIDVPFYRMYLRLNTMSHVTKWNYRLLGARVGKRPLLAAPHTTEPELIEIGNHCMVAGNVSIYGIDQLRKRVEKVTLGESAVVANTCVLQPGSKLPEFSLLGDLSAVDHTYSAPPNTLSVGTPPRVVGRTNFRADHLSASRYCINQVFLAILQWISISLSNVLGYVALGSFLNLLLPMVTIWALWTLIPALLLLQRLIKVGLLPLIKWCVIGKCVPSEHPAYSWYFARWILIETLIMDAEAAFLNQLQGTVFINLLWRALGARVGSNTVILSSSLGCEFDLKDIGANVVLHQQSLVFAHSVENHSLLFRPTKVNDGCEIGSFSIVEAGAVVDKARLIGAHTAIHAKQAKPSEAGSGRLINVFDYEKAAQEKLPKATFEYLSGGAEDNQAVRRNREAFGWLRISPRALVDVSTVSTRCTILGQELASPILIAPTAMQRLAHPDGENAVARSASRLDMGMILSMLSTTKLEEVATIFRGSQQGLPLFQLYLLKDRAITEELILRAECSGYGGLVVTVDAPVSGRREADIRNRFEFANSIALAHLDIPLWQFDLLKDPSLTWHSLNWIRERTKLPIWVKGIIQERDVSASCNHGLDGVILSNHGGRQLDAAPSPLEVAPFARRIIDRSGNKVALIIDGGIRRGSDVFKALALGADFVMIGRPVTFGLAANGQAGVTQVLKLLNDELLLTMKLAGCPTLGTISPEFLHADRDFFSLSLSSRRDAFHRDDLGEIADAR